MILLLVASALALPPDYKQTKEASGCVLALGPADAQNDVPMYAECRWPDVTLERASELMGNWAGHDGLFSTVVTSDVRSTANGVTMAEQTHRAKGIADRQIVLTMQAETVGDGQKFSWKQAPGEPLELAKGNVLCERSEGYWEFHPHADGGVTVVHSLFYDPGGSVPGFLVRWFQTSGLENTVTEFRSAAQ